MKSGWHICTVCNFIYEEGLENTGKMPASVVIFDALPNDWDCPKCGASREMFQPCSCVEPLTNQNPGATELATDVFKYLDTDHHRIENQLRELINNYNKWPVQKIFDNSVRIFDEIRRHFERQKTLLCSPLEGKAASRLLMEQCIQDRKRILDEMDSLIMSHVDDSDFKQNLIALLTRINQHIALSHETLYCQLPQYLSPQEMSELNRKYQDMILGYQ